MDHSMHHDHAANHDHAAMERHDHDHHDHDDHGAHAGHAMAFHASVEAQILFNGWVTTNALELFGSCVAIFLAGMLYEGFKYYREALFVRATTTTGDSRVNIAKNECGSGQTCSGPATVKMTMLSGSHFVQTLLHIVQATVSYILMLIFMTYNVYLCLALVLGLGFGYFCFGWRKSTVIDPNEHCH